MTRKLQPSPDKFKFMTERSIRAEKCKLTLWIVCKVAEICLIGTPHTPTPIMHLLDHLRYTTEDIHIHYPDRCSYPDCFDDAYCIKHDDYIDPNR